MLRLASGALKNLWRMHLNRILRLVKKIYLHFFGRSSVSSKKKSDTIHIIGAGQSVLKSIGLITDDDLVVGMNFSALLPNVTFDYYFVDCCSFERFRTTQKMHTLVGSKDIQAYPRNLLDSSNSLMLGLFLYGFKSIYREKTFKLNPESIDYNKIAERVLLESSQRFINIGSTAITCIQLGYKLNIKNIVLHGVDLGGSYFFDKVDFEHNKNLTPDQRDAGGYNKRYRKKDAFSEKPNINLSNLIVAFQSALCRRGYNLYLAVPEGALATKLPIYKHEK